jgi:hypothetical protein
MTTVKIFVPALNKKVLLNEDSTLISWVDGQPGTSIRLVQPEELFRDEFLPEIEKALAIWRECRWELTTVREMIPSADCSTFVESQSEPFHKLVQGQPLPWMGHWMDEGSVRRHVITDMAKKDGTLEAAEKAAAQEWLDAALAEGGKLVEDGLPPFFEERPSILQDLKDWGWDVPEGTLAGWDGDECVVVVPGQSPVFAGCTEDLAEKLGIEL